MIRKIKTIYSDSDDPEFGTLETQAILIAPDMIIETEEGSPWKFLIIPEVSEEQEVVEVDRAKCGYFALEFSHIWRDEELEPDLNFIEKASFLDFIRKYAK